MKILEIDLMKTNDAKMFDKQGKNWFIKFKLSNNKLYGIELKPEMNLEEIIVEFVKFLGLLTSVSAK